MAMFISMQGNWTVAVKSKNAAFPQRFIITGATSGNGTYVGDVSTSAVSVVGKQWSIAIQNNPGSGFILSEAKLKFPQKVGGFYQFDILSNDAGGDADFDDLILTCRTPVNPNDYIIYGNVSLYGSNDICHHFNCYPGYFVIDSYAALLEALKQPKLKDIIQKLYPERIPPFRLPIPPDPPPFFTPLIINLNSDFQLPPKQVSVFSALQGATPVKTKAADQAFVADYKLDKVLPLSIVDTNIKLNYDRVGLAKYIDIARPFRCDFEPASNITLNFEEYDRTGSEIAGNPYTGTGFRSQLGNAITDTNGNYIFRFTRSFIDNLIEDFLDTGATESTLTQVRPDVIMKVVNPVPFTVLHETPPYFNVPNLKRINLCLPRRRVNPSSFCFNGNLVGSLGNVFIGGTQNIAASESSAALDRPGYNNHLRSDGKISVHNTQAGFNVDCACWVGMVDVKGCLFDVKGTPSKAIRFYTIRYKKPGTTNWEYVTESYLHPKFSKRYLDNYNGDQVGPFPTSLQVDSGPVVSVPAYKNIQAEIFLDGIDWEFSNLDRYIQLNTNIYQGVATGTVLFRIDGYDSAGKPVAKGTDLIALYISNKRLDFGLGAIDFVNPIERVPCNLYKMLPGELNTKLEIAFKAADTEGFVDSYHLGFGKCPAPMLLNMTAPVVQTVSTTTNLFDKNNPSNTDLNSCPGYTGTAIDFSAGIGYVTVELSPDATEGGWLKATEEFAVFSVGLSAVRRQTNGYNGGLDGSYQDSNSFSVIRK
jgi:hypothetical protein